ncbi:hypothetical protein KM1_045780 [Entamoeba histolytica HM-3:IMSS]|uniref:Uncharacterized protein n=6 Tax=Entamoeba histolytica TaxID=5759 RepID=C4M805_ENTH1|nr:hypothetical protein EHI_143590 [Entamoeba histolytica HM-1:IMSS]EMD43390.1 Hypothetical protein EHI5A_037040 [Entamoeba histolytica KU27]EMS17223.1 hypothetical protein KM1_045780 [Entamoeba histolytica HM-3:IMSS]ENY65264.1 hypothetical protein EHI7A_018940 [Entamoeba histolytica HM-1:IMSS-A]GAT97693.1 hypothetical protein CL6EHI_143590 [Entamoeba histolytica]EAL46972.1 hypothetical protein EHI_143590 [Entamoeba histolytica HM-1:IMSS]|eukprot:XP_652358.1 hypothetical protein EHI_143590 [Entamoeba histolytica HM-1:IMSS]
MNEDMSYLTKEESTTEDGCALRYFNYLYELLVSIFFPQQQLKKVNKQLSVFFEDEDNELISNKVCVDGFLGKFNETQLQHELLDYRFGPESTFCGKSFKEIFKEKGFNNLKIVFDTEDYYIHRCQVYNESIDMQHLLIQLFIRCDHTLFIWSSKSFSNSIFQEQLVKGNEFIKNHFKHPNLNVTIVEWLRVQDYRHYCKNKMLLPSQLHTGLGLTREIHYCVQHYAKQSQRDGISNTPEQWHNALQYLRLNPPFKFLNPAYEGIFLSINEAVKNDIKEKGFAEVVWALTSKCLKRKDNGERFEWLKMEQISPMSQELKMYFNSNEYNALVNENYHPENLFIDWDLFYPVHND